MKRNIKIAAFRHKAEILDEGVRIVGKRVSDELHKFAEVRDFEISKSIPIRELRKFDPDICQFCLSFSSPGSSIYPWIVRNLSRKPITSVLALQPKSSRLISLTLRAMGPDLAIVQSNFAKQLFESNGVSTFTLFHGVDTERFRIVDSNEKSLLRKKWGIPRNAMVILHVGAIRKERGVEILSRLPAKDRLVLVIGRKTTALDQDLVDHLVRLDVKVINDFVPNIEELYQIADIYVYPTQDSQGTIDLPLSIIEAMASGCHVISTKFRGIPDWIDKANLTDFITMIDNVSQIPIAVDEKLKSNMKNMDGGIIPSIASWTQMAQELIDMYDHYLHEKK